MILERIEIFTVNTLIKPLWQSLKAGVQSIEGKVCNLSSYFDVQAISINGSFEWEGINFIPVQTVHIMNGMGIVPSYGFIFNEIGDDRIGFLTTDTQFCPRQIEKFYQQATWIFQDCETSPFKSGVHAHYDDLKTLSDSTKKKMWLYHYQPNPSQIPMEDGFAGFVDKGQNFDFKYSIN